jgi:hypothetical protein
MRMIRLYGIVLLGAICGCASTTLTSTWKEPGAGPIQFRKVLVVAPSRDPNVRRSAEDEMVREIKSAHAVASYTFIPETELGNDEAIRARARAAGFDGAVVMRVVSVDKEATWVPGVWSGGIYAYGGWPAYDPGYTRIDTYVRVETNVYSVADDKLLWASASRTTNPSSVRDLVDDTAEAVAKEMKKQGLLL